MTRFEAYACTQCGGTGERRNESQFDELVLAARRWWIAKRPVGWSEALHMERPAVDTSGYEADLAIAVSNILREYAAPEQPE